ncbi:IPExxxVDY family protein [Daejeonella oryzae]|uniref:IPExxxVDY family protein n=1 Tax=Daejeonella oryzae TaxID=1122943 RepID=UPI00040F8ACA|nr:IPExxxVDY family protein [Daejeonella oryzae]
MNKTTLKYELDLDFVLLAITAPLKDYRLCFKINKQLNFDLSRKDELELFFSASEVPVYYSRYLYHQAHTDTEFHLIANKGTGGFLIPEMKTVDFFLLIRNYIDEEELRALISSLNKIPEILVAVEVDPKKLKSKENLIF